MPRYRTLNNDAQINVDRVALLADSDGAFTVVAGSRAEAVLIAGGAVRVDAQPLFPDSVSGGGFVAYITPLIVASAGGDFNAVADAADAAAVAAGGGDIWVAAGEYRPTRSMPTIKSGVRWRAGLPQPGGEIGVVANKGVRLIAATKYSYDCFTDGRVDLALMGSGQPNCITGAMVAGFYIEGFRYGIKSGALYNFGLFESEISDNVVNDCSEWGIWLENFFHTPVARNRVNNCGKGQIAAVASSHYNTGNSKWESLNANTAPTRVSRGIVFMCRGDVASGGSLNDMQVQKLASVCTSSITPDNLTATPAGVGSSLLNMSASDIAKLYVHAPLWVAASINGLTGLRCYFVRSIDTTNNQITLSNNPDGGFAASTALTYTATTSMTLLCGGAPNLEIIGSPQAEFQPSSFHGLDLENGGSIRVLHYKATQVEIKPHLCQGGPLTDFVVRDATPILWSLYNQLRVDFDLASKSLQRYGRWKSITSSGGQSAVNSGQGLYRVHDTPVAGAWAKPQPGTMVWSLGGGHPTIYEPMRGTGVGLVGSLVLWHNQVGAGGDPKGGGCATITASGATLTIAASSDTAAPFNLGETIFVSNPQAAAATLQSADALRFIGKGTSASSYSLPANTNCTLILQKDGTGLYWAVY